MTDYHWTDWLNPILVREARQGLRERLFAGGLLVLLMGLGFFVIYQCEDPDNVLDITAEQINSLVWILFVYALPLRAFFSSNIAREIKDYSFEGLILSNLSIRYILYGKWISSVFQSLLIVTIFMPFFIVQYWMGGDDILTNLSALFSAFFLGGILTALTISLSSIKFVLLRYVSLILIGGFFQFFKETPLVLPFSSVWIGGFGFLLFPYLTFEIVAPHIDLSESHPLRRRLSLIATYLLSFAFVPLGDGFEALFFILFAFAALLEPLQPSGLKNSSRWYLIRCWFSQDKLSGFLFMLVGVAIGVIGLVSYHIFVKHYIDLVEGRTVAAFIYLTMISYMLLPLLVAELISYRFPYRTVTSGLTNAILLTLFGLIHQSLDSYHYTYLYSIFPSSFLFLHLQNDRQIMAEILFSDFIIFLLLSSLYLWRMARGYR